MEARALRLGFQETPWDLRACLAYTAGVAIVLSVWVTGTAAAVLLVAFAPGYVLVALLFPGTNEIDWIERLALSFGLSVAVVPLLGIALAFTPFGIGSSSIEVSVSVFTLLFGSVAYWRRMRLSPAKRLAAMLEFEMPTWKQHSPLEKGLSIALVATAVAAVGTLGYVMVTTAPPQLFTDFYILGPGGNASGYPTALNVSQPGSVILGIANHEARSVNYTLHVDLVGLRIVHNDTSGSNETIEANRTSWSAFTLSLADGENWSLSYMFRINETGLWKVQFLLFRNGDFSREYKELHLYVRVS